MKKTKFIISTALFLLSLCMNAQSGSWYIGGSGGFDVSQTKDFDDSKVTTWNFSPEIGTFLTDNVQLGLAINLLGEQYRQQNDDVTETYTGGTLYGRYFFKPGSAFRPFIGLNVSALPGTIKFDDDDSNNTFEVKSFLFGTNLNAGFGYAIAPKWTVVGSFATLGFASFSEEPENADKITNTSFGLDVNTLGNRFNIGFYYTFK